jgi:hypothetical protein
LARKCRSTIVFLSLVHLFLFLLKAALLFLPFPAFLKTARVFFLGANS